MDCDSRADRIITTDYNCFCGKIDQHFYANRLTNPHSLSYALLSKSTNSQMLIRIECLKIKISSLISKLVINQR
jgi:hypothetical protein